MGERFERSGRETVVLGMSTHVIVDRETGVNYLFVQSGYSGGLTPLFDNHGNPIVTPVRSSYDPER